MIGRVYDVGGPDWVEVPLPRHTEDVADYGVRLKRWAQKEMVKSAAYGGGEPVVCEHATACVVVEVHDQESCVWSVGLDMEGGEEDVEA
jgi:hypothetical protein